MGRVRYAKSLRDLEKGATAEGDVRAAALRQVRCVYETDAEVAQAVVPRPLEAMTDPKIHVHFSSTVWPGSLEATREIRWMSFGVGVHYDGREAIYPLTVALDHEASVTEGRERFGLPGKLAEIAFDVSDTHVRAAAERKGIEYVVVSGERAEGLDSREQNEEFYSFKAFPGCQPGKGFDQDPQLVRTEVHYRFDHVLRLEGRLDLVESSFDPVVDLPVRRMVSLEFVTGRCSRHARVVRPVPGDWLLPFLHQRLDAPGVDGLDV